MIILVMGDLVATSSRQLRRSASLRRTLRVAWSALAVVSAAAVNAQTGAEPPPERKVVCENIANVFYTIALYEERGDSKESQIEWVLRTYENASSAQVRIFLRAVDYVYASDIRPQRLRRLVHARCKPTSDGRAVIDIPGL